MDLIGQLNSLGIDVNCKFHYINHGGCAVYAAIVGKELRDMGVNTKVLIAANMWGPRTTVDEARKHVKSVKKKEHWRANGIFFGHVGLEFWWERRKYHYDSNGCHKPEKTLDNCQIYKGRMTVDECIALARERSGWNESFNRRHIPVLRKMVARHFNEMKAMA